MRSNVFGTLKSLSGVTIPRITPSTTFHLVYCGGFTRRSLFTYNPTESSLFQLEHPSPVKFYKRGCQEQNLTGDWKS